MKKLAIFISFIWLFSCNQEKSSEEVSSGSKNTEAFDQQIQTINQEVVLVPEAREQALQWVNFIIAQNEINNLRDATVSQVMENSRPLAQIMEALKTSVPDSLRSTPVEARLNVLATKANVLHQLSSQREPKPEQIAKTAGELPAEFNNFKLQLNELFLKTFEDFERELDEWEETETSRPVNNL